MNEVDFYERVCEPRMEQIERKVDRVLTLLEGNGTPGLRVMVDRNTRIGQALTWLCGVLVVQAVGVVAALLMRSARL